MFLYFFTFIYFEQFHKRNAWGNGRSSTAVFRENLVAICTDISMDIYGKSVDMDMDIDGKFHIHGKPAYFHSPKFCISGRKLSRKMKFSNNLHTSQHLRKRWEKVSCPLPRDTTALIGAVAGFNLVLTIRPVFSYSVLYFHVTVLLLLVDENK